MAIPWGIVFLVVFFIAMTGIRQQLKEAVEYTAARVIYGTVAAVSDYHVVTAVKKNIKEGIEFVAKTGSNEIKQILNDPQVKQDIKEALEYTGRQIR